MPPQSLPWYITRDGKQHGPIADAELKRLVDLGQLQPTDFLWRQDFAEWRPALALFPQLKPATRGPVDKEQGENQAQVARVVQRPATKVRSNRAVSSAADVADDGAAEEQSVIWRRRIVRTLVALLCAAAIGAASGYVFKWYANPTALARSK